MKRPVLAGPRMTRRALWRIASASLLSPFLFNPRFLRAQEEKGAAAPEEVDSVIRVDVDLVNLLFTVRGKNGELAGNLTKDDVLVFEDGKEQTIAHFSKESDLPLELGMLVDVSASQTNLIETERRAGTSFFKEVIRTNDEAFLLAFGHDTVLIQDFTNSVPKLEAGLNSLKSDFRPGMMGGRGSGAGNGGGYPGAGGGGGRRGGGGMGWPGGGMGWPGGGGGMGGRRRGGGGYPRGGRAGGAGGGQQSGRGRFGTLMFDAVYLATTDEINRKKGRKALFLVTDGEDQGSFYSREQAVESAQRADTILYSIYYVDERLYARFGRSHSMRGLADLRKMSEETGGRVFTVSKDKTLEDVFTELQAEMRSQYSIGYKSTNRDRNGEFREIEIRPKNTAYQVQTRKGYYATRNRPA